MLLVLFWAKKLTSATKIVNLNDNRVVATVKCSMVSVLAFYSDDLSSKLTVFL